MKFDKANILAAFALGAAIGMQIAMTVTIDKQEAIDAGIAEISKETGKFKLKTCVRLQNETD